MKNCPLCYDLLWNNDNDNCPVQHKLVWYKSSRTVYFNQSMVQYGIMGHWISFPFFCVMKMIVKQLSTTQNRGSTRKAWKHVVTVFA